MFLKVWNSEVMDRMFSRCRRGLILALCLTGLAGVGADAANDGRLFTVRLVSHGANTSLTVGLVRPSAFHARIDAGSNRLLVDFRDISAIPGASMGHGTGLVRSYHAEPLSGGGIRLAFDLTHAAVIAVARTEPAETGAPPRAVIELTSASVAAMRAASASADLRDGGRPEDHLPKGAAPSSVAPSIAAPSIAALIAEPGSIAPPPRMKARSAQTGAVQPARRVIVIDAGHGGVDPGAPSIAGYHEKEVTLAAARILGRVLEQTGRYRVVLTRDTDVFLKLHERVALARAAHGDLFISLHADSAAEGARSRTRGASIYTLSETASDAESARYAQRENRADAIGGIPLSDQSDDVAGILVDLTVRETVNQGNRLAAMMAECLARDGVELLPRAPRRAAGFAVLKSPDIPSVLIEMGYLSDPSDARALADPRHQLRIARAVAEGVDRYFAWLDQSRS
jgi:N-acetylmuramoyl-L-alanine amidase